MRDLTIVLGYLGRKAARQPYPLQTWAPEGGAVPLASNPTAAQVGPYETP